jgi:predicted O-methyltransferase YrrM
MILKKLLKLKKIKGCKYEPGTIGPHTPTWKNNNNSDFINVFHENIYNLTEHLEGWQRPEDSMKLFEMGYFAGDTILEIGVYRGRSAVVSLLGSIASNKSPKYYGVDISEPDLKIAKEVLTKFALINYANFFLGNIEQFLKVNKIKPTMVFVDGDHSYEQVKKDLETILPYLSRETPVLCHDYVDPLNDTGEYGIQKAVNELVEQGYYEYYGTFGCSVLLFPQK